MATDGTEGAGIDETSPGIDETSPGIDGELIAEESRRLVETAAAAGLSLRLMGGVAVWLTSPSVRRRPYRRPYRDLDLAVPSRHGRAVTPFLVAAGYVPEKLFNALHGASRLNFGRPDGRWTVDVVLDELDMSHRIDLRGRLDGPGPTIDLADLLLTKLQVFEINRKDLGDIACLLADHEIADAAAPNVIDRSRILSLTGSDWGLCHTVERNLRRTADQALVEPPEDAPFAAAGHAEALLAAIAAAPRSLGWKARALVGESVRWYETPEEVRH
ncbi:MAG TPA: hypothetical protein VJZ72_05290 [Candidatus Limnocylindrales bacterium]|nr:hypothetical protein [Candidatus Limnocylindrales bacterium]